MGSEPEAANNPNSVPVLTAIQGLSLLSAYLKDNDLLVLRGIRTCWMDLNNLHGKKVPLTTQDLVRSSH